MYFVLNQFMHIFTKSVSLDWSSFPKGEIVGTDDPVILKK